MAYTPIHAWKRKDKLPSKDPQKIIYGKQLQDEFDAISRQLNDLDGQVEIDGPDCNLDSLYGSSVYGVALYSGGNSGGGGTGGDYDDTQIKADLSAETNARIAGDADLQTQIDSLPSGGASTWDELSGKPTEFPPEAHTQGWDTITGTPSQYPPAAHTHEIDEVNGLQDALDNADLPSTHVGPDAPDPAVEGQLWLNTDDGYLYVYYDNAGNPTWMAVEREA
jgi:hypothetical protein